MTLQTEPEPRVWSREWARETSKAWWWYAKTEYQAKSQTIPELGVKIALAAVVLVIFLLAAFDN